MTRARGDSAVGSITLNALSIELHVLSASDLTHAPSQFSHQPLCPKSVTYFVVAPQVVPEGLHRRRLSQDPGAGKDAWVEPGLRPVGTIANLVHSIAMTE